MLPGIDPQIITFKAVVLADQFRTGAFGTATDDFFFSRHDLETSDYAILLSLRADRKKTSRGKIQKPRAHLTSSKSRSR